MTVFRRHVETTDVEAAERAVRERYGSVVFDPAGDDARLSYTEDSVSDGRLSFTRVSYGGELRSTTESPFVSVATCSRGRNSWTYAAESGQLAVAPALFQPGHPVSSEIEDAEMRVLNFDPEAMTETARVLYGDDELDARFASAHAISPALGRHWSAMLDFVSEVTTSEAYEYELIRASIYRTAAVTTLEAFPLTVRTDEHRATASDGRRTYRRASQFIDDHADRPITLDDIARHAEATPTAVAQAFRANAVDTADERLRRVRLDGAHHELRRTDPIGGRTVVEIARRWGFADPAAFEREYHATFGEAPEQALWS